MTCAELQSFLYPYLDGEFDAKERAAFEQHLAGCEPCARRVHAEALAQNLIRERVRASSVAAPDALRAKIQSNLSRLPEPGSSRRWAQVSAAAMIAAAAAGAYLYDKSGDHRLFLEDAARRHAKHLPFEIQQVTPEGMEEWFRGKLDHRVNVPRLANATLAGARLSNVQHKPAAYIRYEANPANGAKRQLGLFVFGDDDEEVEAPSYPAVRVSSTHGYNVAVWRDGELVYELVTDLDEHDIRRMLTDPIAPPAPTPFPAPNTAVQPASFRP